MAADAAGPGSERGRRFIFVGGAPRSGTTLVQNMLDCHPEILGGPEFLHLVRIVELRTAMRRDIARGAIDAFCSEAELDQLIAGLIEDLLLPFAARHGGGYLSEKTPSNALVFAELMELFPGARCVFVMRDPRAVISSMLEVGERAAGQGRRAQRFTRDLDAAIAHVKACFRAAHAAALRWPDRLLALRYESLVTAPEAETRRICGFLGLPWTEAMLTPASRDHPGEKAITGTSLWYDPASFRRDPDPAGIHKWKSRLSARQKALITLAFEAMPELADTGYALGAGDLSGREYALGRGAQALDRLAGRLRRTLRPVS